MRVGRVRFAGKETTWLSRKMAAFRASGKTLERLITFKSAKPPYGCFPATIEELTGPAFRYFGTILIRKYQRI